MAPDLPAGALWGSREMVRRCAATRVVECHPRRSCRRGTPVRPHHHNPALPEPPAAKWRRLWILWPEATRNETAVVGSWVHVVWIASIIGLALMLVFGTEAVRRQAGEVYVVRALGLLAAVFLLVPLACLFKFLVWWLSWMRPCTRRARRERNWRGL